jgi:putative endonuclease
MSDARQVIGRRGEDLAAAFLSAKGFIEVARNWRCRVGEIDLIVKRGNEVRFVEVKLRRTETYGNPEEAITRTKLRHLARTVECWLLDQAVEPKQYQVDAVAIKLLSGREPEIVWIEGIL